jgi:pimeloyl-ACP methyl ester carboxylesterase
MEIMSSLTEDDLQAQYRQFMTEFPVCLARFKSEDWRWIDSGDGDTQTIILLPGFMGEAETSFLYVQALATHLRVISISYPPTVARVDSLCDGLCTLLDNLKIQQATFLGGSSSGFIAQAFIRRHPTRTAGLILTHTGLPSPQRARTARLYLSLLHLIPYRLVHWLMQRSVYTYFPRQTASHLFWRQHFQEVIRRQNLEALRNRFAQMDDFHTHYHFQPGDLTAWHGKILLMEMHHDHLTSPAEQSAMRELYPTARVHVFTNTAHYDSVEQPEEQIQVIKEFLLHG